MLNITEVGFLTPVGFPLEIKRTMNLTKTLIHTYFYDFSKMFAPSELPLCDMKYILLYSGCC